MGLFNELPTAFPWYNIVEKQHRFRENVIDKYQDYGLINPTDALLPFEFYSLITGLTVTQWRVYDLDGVQVEEINSLALVLNATRDGRQYFYYGGQQLTTIGGPLNLPPGYYYSRIRLSNNDLYYSEVIHVPECGFSVNDVTTMNFLRLEWYNDSDLRPIFYNDKDIVNVPKFRNAVYLDTFIHVSEPEIEEETIPDGNEEDVPVFQKALIRRRITELVPDFLRVALALLKMHDHVFLTTPRGIRTGELSKVTASFATDFAGAFSTVEIVFEETLVMIKKGCADNMA